MRPVVSAAPSVRRLYLSERCLGIVLEWQAKVVPADDDDSLSDCPHEREDSFLSGSSVQSATSLASCACRLSPVASPGNRSALSFPLTPDSHALEPSLSDAVVTPDASAEKEARKLRVKRHCRAIKIAVQRMISEEEQDAEMEAVSPVSSQPGKTCLRSRSNPPCGRVCEARAATKKGPQMRSKSEAEIRFTNARSPSCLALRRKGSCCSFKSVKFCETLDCVD